MAGKASVSRRQGIPDRQLTGGPQVSETKRRQVGDSDSPIEDELEGAFNRMVDEGTQRLHRTWREVLVTGFFGGTEVAVGVLAYLSVLAATSETAFN